MGLTKGQRSQDVAVEHIFIGSCTNSRIEDLRAAADVVKGNRLAGGIKQALVVPGSGLVKRQAEEEGLDRIFTEAGFEWRSEEHTSELQSLMRISYAVLCLKKKPTLHIHELRCSTAADVHTLLTRI